jgi:hypothetical protein
VQTEFFRKALQTLSPSAQFPRVRFALSGFVLEGVRDVRNRVFLFRGKLLKLG